MNQRTTYRLSNEAKKMIADRIKGGDPSIAVDVTSIALKKVGDMVSGTFQQGMALSGFDIPADKLRYLVEIDLSQLLRIIDGELNQMINFVFVATYDEAPALLESPLSFQPLGTARSLQTEG